VTLADSVRWLFEQSHITAREAGMLATKLDDSCSQSELASCQQIGRRGLAAE
jgi:hypothetical protein